MLFCVIAVLMLSQVLIVYPHVQVNLFKYILALSCLATLITFVLASKSQPGYLKRLNSDQSTLLNLLKKVDADRICPTCELVQANMAYHCTACNRCIVDFDSHSILVNNCISGNNRQYLIVFLMSLLSFFLLLCMISFLHFKKPAQHFQSIIQQEDADSIIEEEVMTDPDGPYQTFIVSVFVISVLAIVPIFIQLRSQCNLYGRGPSSVFWSDADLAER